MIRELLFQGNNREAQDLMYKIFVPKKPEKGGTYGTFQMLANLDINYLYDSTNTISQYERGLDLTTAVAYTQLTRGEQRFERRYFASRDKDVLLINLTATSVGKLNRNINMSRTTVIGEDQQANTTSQGMTTLH